MQLIASGFDYVFHFIQLNDKRQKRLKSIYQLCCDDTGKITIDEICSFDLQSESWTFKKIIGKDQESWGLESDFEKYTDMCRRLNELELHGPIKAT